MTVPNAQKSRVLLGSIHLSGYLKGATGKVTVDKLDTTSLIDTAEQSIPGRESSTFDLDMLLDTDTTTGGQADVLTAWKATAALPLSFGPNGLSRGSEMQLVSALETSYTPSTAPAGLAMVKVAAVTDGFIDFGVSLEDLTAIAADTTGTATDNTAASSNGGVAHLHVTGYSGLTSDAIIVEHSVDNSVWATLVTFTSVTARGNQRVVVAAGTTVRRYMRVSDDVTGTGTCTRAVSFARR